MSPKLQLSRHAWKLGLLVPGCCSPQWPPGVDSRVCWEGRGWAHLQAVARAELFEGLEEGETQSAWPGTWRQVCVILPSQWSHCQRKTSLRPLVNTDRVQRMMRGSFPIRKCLRSDVSSVSFSPPLLAPSIH